MRGRVSHIHAALVVTCLFSSVGAGAQPPPAIVLAGGVIIASPSAVPMVRGTVVIEGGRIVALGTAVPRPAGARVIDCENLFVVAGFQNSHVHFTEEKWADAGRQPAATLAAHLQAMPTAFGFTTVVDTASLLDNTLAVRRRSESGEVPGPRILTAGLALYPENGIPYYVRDAIPTHLLELLPQPANSAQAAALVQRNLGQGADIVKLFTGSWVSPQRVVTMSEEVASAAVAEAHRRGKLVFSHPSNAAGLDVAMASGVDVIAHAIDDTRQLSPAQWDRMRRQDIALVPTLKLLAPDGRADVLDQVRDYARLGGQILFGTDVGYLPDYNPLREYELMEAAGLTRRAILASLTTGPARRFQESSRRGQLAEGMEADIVVLGSDPDRDLRAFADVRYTIRAGRIIYQR